MEFNEIGIMARQKLSIRVLAKKVQNKCASPYPYPRNG